MSNMAKNQSRTPDLYKSRQIVIPKAQQDYRRMGFMMFCIASGVLLVRVLVTLLSSYIKSDLALDVTFSMILQIGVLLILPVLLYLNMFKKKPREILEFSYFKKTAPYNYAISVAIGFVVFFASLGVSLIWQNLIAGFGYTHSSSSDDFPEKFNFFRMLLSFFITAVLPGFCEEFAVRGGLLKTVRSSFSFAATIGVMGIAFGLFHQYITQVFYTGCFGMLMAYIVLKTKSIYPAMIIHFLNNGISVYLDYAEEYGFWGKNFFDNLSIGLMENTSAVLGLYLVICAILVGLIFLLTYLNNTDRLAKKKEVILDSGFDVTHGKVVLMGHEDKDKVRELGLDKEVYGQKLKEDLYKPTARDNIFFIGAIVISVLSTIFTFIWGYIV